MELKASELRENNKLLFMGKVVTFDYIAKKRVDGIFWIKVKEPNLDHKNFHFKPIELSEEILLKCGFYQNEDLFYIGEIGLYLDDNVWWNDELINGRMFYLHQLQNLYFALTQTELEINL